MERSEEFKLIRYLIMDVDGTLTDGKIYIGDGTLELKAFNVKDGYGIRNVLPLWGIIPIVITGRESAIVSRRCEELNIKELYQGAKDKCSIIKNILSINQLSRTAYMGDDINDLEAMEMISAAGGIVACPSDAVSTVCQAADYISKYKGGDGAVRDFIDWLVNRMQVSGIEQ